MHDAEASQVDVKKAQSLVTLSPGLVAETLANAVDQERESLLVALSPGVVAAGEALTVFIGKEKKGVQHLTEDGEAILEDDQDEFAQISK